MLYNKHDDPKSKITHIHNTMLNLAKLTNVQPQTLEHQQPWANLVNQGSQWILSALEETHSCPLHMQRSHVSLHFFSPKRKKGEISSSNPVF